MTGVGKNIKIINHLSMFLQKIESKKHYMYTERWKAFVLNVYTHNHFPNSLGTHRLCSNLFPIYLKEVGGSSKTEEWILCNLMDCWYFFIPNIGSKILPGKNVPFWNKRLLQFFHTKKSIRLFDVNHESKSLQCIFCMRDN